MSELRLRPKSDYIEKASWEELYHLTQHWQSEMEFYRDEIHFIYKLINQFFSQLLEHESIRSLQILIQKVSDAEAEVKQIQENIQMHLSHFEAIMRHTFSREKDAFRSEHADLENRITNLEIHFKKLKREVFELAEEVMRSEKMKHLLTMKT